MKQSSSQSKLLSLGSKKSVVQKLIKSGSSATLLSSTATGTKATNPNLIVYQKKSQKSIDSGAKTHRPQIPFQ